MPTYTPEASYGHAKFGCYRCGSPGPGVDFDIIIEGEGGLFLCRPCIIDAFRLLDWEVDRERDRTIERLRSHIKELEEHIDSYESLVKTLKKSWDMHKAREARGGKRSASDTVSDGMARMGLDPVVPPEDHRPAAEPDLGSLGSAGGS